MLGQMEQTYIYIEHFMQEQQSTHSSQAHMEHYPG